MRLGIHFAPPPPDRIKGDDDITIMYSSRVGVVWGRDVRHLKDDAHLLPKVAKDELGGGEEMTPEEE